MRRLPAALLLVTTVSTALHAQPARRAAIGGRVIDDAGDPVIGVRVTVEQRTAGGGIKVVSSTETDDRGEYRVPGLLPGTFLVAAWPLAAPRPGPPVKMYFPGVETAAAAESVTVQSGSDRADVDMFVRADQSTIQPFSIAGGGGATMTISTFVERVPRAGKGIIHGRVIDAQGRPLPRAQVGLFLYGARQPTRELARADGGGVFEFRDLPSATYRVVASKAGYAPIDSENAAEGFRIMRSGRLVMLAAGEALEHVEIALAPLATLSGHVLDENGEPLQGASVSVLHIRYEDGRRQLVPADVTARLTDDFGRYRLYGLDAGQYIVSASIGSVSTADVAGYVRSYFPATSNPADAQFVSLRTSEELAGIDVAMVRGRTARVAGRILEPGGAPTTAGSVRLRPRQRSSVVGVSVGARLSSDGFEFLNVPPGDYVIQVTRDRSNSWTEAAFGALPVVVNGEDVTGLVLQLSAGSTVTGSIRFDTLDPSRLPAPASIRLTALSADIDLSPPRNFAVADIRADWSFRMAGLNGPRRLELESVLAGWMLKEVLVNGIDATDRPLSFGRREESMTGVEVVLTDRVNELSGTITDDRTGPAAGSNVIVFSTDRARWFPASRFLRTAVAGTGGRFVVPGLPAGSYNVAAIARLPQDGDGAWQDPAFLEGLNRNASVVTITEGQQRSINVQLPAR